ncbi:MAG: homoserine kinase [Aestuariibacter sp.]
MKHKAYAPASIGNVSLGFDVLGAALAPVDGSPLGDTVELSTSEAFNLSVAGPFAHKLPADSDTNIVTRCYHYFHEQLAKRNVQATHAALVLNKNLPIGSGLGSSASSVVAALHGLNVHYGSLFSDDELLLMMGELEGQISGSVHYDNVAPCFLGGLTLMVLQGERIATRLPVIEDWFWVVCYSGISVSTAAAREILPKQFDMATVLSFGRQLAVFVDALHRNDADAAAAMIQDVIAEPYRKSLLPHFDQSRDFALQHGAKAFGISGSGPTVFAVCPDESSAQQISGWLSEHYIQNQDGFSHVCKLSSEGSTVIEET